MWTTVRWWRFRSYSFCRYWRSINRILSCDTEVDKFDPLLSHEDQCRSTCRRKDQPLPSKGLLTIYLTPLLSVTGEQLSHLNSAWSSHRRKRTKEWRWYRKTNFFCEFLINWVTIIVGSHWKRAICRLLGSQQIPYLVFWCSDSYLFGFKSSHLLKRH